MGLKNISRRKASKDAKKCLLTKSPAAFRRRDSPIHNYIFPLSGQHFGR